MGPRVSAIVPAYNEAKRVGEVLKVLTTYPGFLEVIVIDDGSLDGTAKTARAFETVRVARSEDHMGKGEAMEAGTRQAAGDIFFFCDADLVGLTHEHIDAILAPVLSGKYDMFVGMRKKKIRNLGFGYSWTPLLDGQRAVTRELWATLPKKLKRGYWIEPVLNHYASLSPKGYGYKGLEYSNIRKEKKRGFFVGKYLRMRMYYELFRAHIELGVRDFFKEFKRVVIPSQNVGVKSVVEQIKKHGAAL